MFIDHFCSFDPSFKKVSMDPVHYRGVHGPGPYKLLEQAVHDISYFLHEMKLLTGDLLPSPSPLHFFFSRSNFRAITRLETLATPGGGGGTRRKIG